jgi:uncharacterized delta-60 repeat protein
MRFFLLPLLLIASVACGADGSVDMAFGTGGNIVIAPPDSSPEALAVAVQSDGRIVVGGTIWAFGQDLYLNQAAIWRFLPDGSIDSSFGNGGLSTTDFSVTIPYVFSVLPLDNGDILAAGNYAGFGVIRLHANGVPDKAFGSNGLALVDFSAVQATGTAAFGVAVDAQGRILLAGNCHPTSGAASGPHVGAVARLLPSGAPDPNFGMSGVVAIPVGTTTEFSTALFRGVQVDAEGRIWLSGSTNATSAGGVNSFLAARLDDHGGLDANFGDGGVAAFNLASDSDDWGNNAVLDHSTLTIGGSCDPSTSNALLCSLRLTDTGAADPTYGNQGWAIAALGSGSRRPASIACQSDGKCLTLVSSPSPVTSLRQFVVARMDTSGHPDPTFGVGGIVRVDVPAGGDGAHIEARGIAIQGGRPILVGTTDGVPYVYGFFATRLDNDLIFSSTFD